MKEDTKLEACPNPWCTARARPLPVRSLVLDRHRVACECGVRTFAFDTEAEAIAAWNTRK